MQKKVKAAGVGGALATVIVWTASVAGLDMPAEVASAWASLIAVGAAWVKSDDTQP